jgi:glutamate 5-kinase
MKAKIWIIKVGSQTLIEEGPLFIQSMIRDIAFLQKNFGIKVVIVSSGAIATAKVKTEKNWKNLKQKQALSAIGQPLIMNHYNTALHEHGLMGAQILLTYADFKNPLSRKNFLNTLRQLLEWNIVPILNENDAIATEEIQFGDNDMLSALVAAELRAAKLVLLTNVLGIYDQDPTHAQAQLLDVISDIRKFKVKGKINKSEYGRGGIPSKILAAKHACLHGVETLVLKANTPNILVKAAQSKAVGTWIKSVRKS